MPRQCHPQAGELVRVSGYRTVGATTRLKMQFGWISETSKRGTVLVLRPGSEHGYMYLLRAAPVRA